MSDSHDAPPDQASARPPAVHTGLETTEPSTVAAGPKAVLESLRHLKDETGLVRGLKALAKMNQFEGFDCPGCAWPDPDDHRSAIAEYCENGAKALAEEATLKRCGPELFARHGLAELGGWSDLQLGKSGRLTHPMLLREGAAHYEPVSWDEAFGVIAEELRALGSADEAIFYTSGRTSNEAAFLYQLFVRAFGTNNLPDCSNMCHESSGVGLTETIGIGKGTVTLADFDAADLILVIGQNPGTNHPRMLSALADAKDRGAKVVAINPLREAALARFKHPQKLNGIVGSGTRIADHTLQVRINGDVALLKGLAKVVLDEEKARPGTVLDRAFIEARTVGFEAFAEDVAATTWAEIEKHSGVPRAEIELVGRWVAASRAMIACWAMGLTQHENGVANTQAVIALLLLGGHFGRPGAGACPVRGHSNVQGDRTMGIYEKPAPWVLDRIPEVFGFSPPSHEGFDTVAAIEAMRDGRAHVFVGMGGNFLSATPDTDVTAEALRRCRLTVQVSTKLNRSHLVTGRRALILPCLGRSETDRQEGGEQFVSVEDSMSVVHASRGRLEPASEHLLSEPMIVARMAQAVLGDRVPVPWVELASDYDRIRDGIARCVPGFDDYNVRVRGRGGFYLPNPPRDSRRFETEDGRARFAVHEIPAWDLAPGELLMMTIRSHDQYNTTIYGLDDRYRGIHRERRVILVSAADCEALALAPGTDVDVTSHFEGETRTARNFTIVVYDIPRGCCATYFPEANALVPLRSFARGSRTPTSKSVIVTLSPSQAGRP